MTEPPSTHNTMTPVDAFERLDLRVGRILDVQNNPASRQPAFILRIDFGPLGIKTSSAQLTTLYDADALVGRFVIAAVNLGTRKIAGVNSEVLVLGLPDEREAVVLLTPEREVPLGGRVY
jgi:tRNA-binding protein